MFKSFSTLTVFLFTLILSSNAEARFCTQTARNVFDAHVIRLANFCTDPNANGYYWVFKRVDFAPNSAYAIAYYEPRTCSTHIISPEQTVNYGTGCGDSAFKITPLLPGYGYPQLSCASIVHNSTQVLGESIPVVGANFSLNYFTSRVKGRAIDYTLKIPVTTTSFAYVSSYDVTIKNDAGTVVHTTNLANTPNLTYNYATDGMSGS